MKRYFWLIVFAVLTAGSVSAAENWWVFLRGKGNLSNEQIQNIAGRALTGRALKRLHGIGKSPGIMDVPIYKPYIDSLRAAGFEIVGRSKWLNAVAVSIPDDKLDRLSHFSFVVSLTRCATYRMPKPVSTPAPQIRREMADTLYGISRFQLDMLGVPYMHSRGYTGKGIRLAMLDTGCRLGVPALRDADVVATYDFINDTTDVDVDTAAGEPDGQATHGTETMMTVGGYLPGVAVGPAYEAEFLIAKTERTYEEIVAEEYDWVEAIEWADSLGADIISSSLGYYDWYSFADLDGNTAITTQIADWAASRGILMVNSAGNERGGFGHIIAPADGDSVLAVGAQKQDGSYADFSSPGPSYDGRIKPDVTALGWQVKIPDPYDTSGTSAISVYGTSFSCPLTAGTAALVMQALWQSGDTIRGWDVAERLKAFADQHLMPDNDYGWGRVIAPVASGICAALYVMAIDSASVHIVPDSIVIWSSDTHFTTATDARGVFTYYPLTAGNYAITLFTSGFAPFDTQFTADGTNSIAMVIDITKGSAPATGWIDFRPNPAADKMTVVRREYNTPASIVIAIFDAAGALVLERSLNLDIGVPSESIPLDGLSSGIYIVRIQEKGTERSYSGKLIVAR